MERVMKIKSDLLIYDLDNKLDDSLCDIIYWSSYSSSESNRIFSIPQLVEDHADSLKAKYLRSIYEFGELKVNGKTIIDHLVIHQNFSYWWMTLFVEKCNYAKSPQIDNIIKIMALEQWLQENKYQKIKIMSANVELIMSVSLLAKKLQIDFEFEREQNLKPNRSFRSLRSFFNLLPSVIQAPIWLVYYLFANWTLKGVGVEAWRKTTATLTFVSYLVNLEPESLKKGRFESRFWTTLTDLLDDKHYSSNWLHIYIENDLLPTPKKARNLIHRFNSIQNGHQVHVTLESFLSITIIFRTLKDWYKVLKLNKLVSKQLKLTSGYLWPLHKKDCRDSMTGIHAISNLLYYNLFEKAMNDLPIQSRGCYLQENQGWEFGFISAWKKSGHKDNLIGFAHASICYWDIRYFFDPRSYNSNGRYDLPMPDYIAVNGEAGKNMYLNGGFPKERLVELESLRYLYLHNYSSESKKVIVTSSKDKVVLIVTDFLEENTYKQLNLLLEAQKEISEPVRYIVKAHPGCPVNIINFPGLNAEVSTRPLEELMKQSDIIYSSSMTSASIDAYCAGLPIITFLDGSTLNVSPLRGYEGVYFVQNSEDLSSAINIIKVTDSVEKVNYFHLDPSLPRWSKWLTDDLEKIKIKS
jgi:surface carbohydrate biosynthesis protein (TIGR04326 family)